MQAKIFWLILAHITYCTWWFYLISSVNELTPARIIWENIAISSDAPVHLTFWYGSYNLNHKNAVHDDWVLIMGIKLFFNLKLVLQKDECLPLNTSYFCVGQAELFLYFGPRACASTHNCYDNKIQWCTIFIPQPNEVAVMALCVFVWRGRGYMRNWNCLTWKVVFVRAAFPWLTGMISRTVKIIIFIWTYYLPNILVFYNGLWIIRCTSIASWNDYMASVNQVCFLRPI